MKKIFNATCKDYEQYNGEVTVIRKLTEEENETEGDMYKCLSPVGEFEAFEDELTEIK